MNFTVTRSIQHLRRARRCSWCPEPLAQGDAAVRFVGIWQEIFGGGHFHPECQAAWVRDPCTIKNEACPCDHHRGMTCVETTP